VRVPPVTRRFDGADLVELSLVCAVATVLIIRISLELSGYPKLGGHGLHIAHVLYGGLMMLAALFLVFILLDSPIRWFAAFMGGVGFGFFIDEVGKFISNDVDYFFEPAVAVMYVVFVVLFLILIAVRRRLRTLSPREARANALTRLAETRGGALDDESRRGLTEMLDRADPTDPLVEILRAHVRDAPSAPPPRRWSYERLRSRLAATYRRVALSRGFGIAIVTIAVLYFISKLPVTITIQSDDSGVDIQGDGADLAHVLQAVASGASAAFTLIGLVLLRRSRLRAYRWFLRAVLVSLLISQVFVFYYDQFAALGGLVFDLLIYGALRYMIGREEAEEGIGAQPARRPAPADETAGARLAEG
jgi:hypothetical protein